MRFKRILFFLIITISACSPDHEEWIIKANRAIKLENSEQALQYMQKAYESTLENDLFMTNRDQVNYLVRVSANKNWVLLVNLENNPRKNILQIIELKSKDTWEAEIPVNIRDGIISPDGVFAMFKKSRTDSLEDLCNYIVWSRESDEFHKIELDFDCSHAPAISDEGFIYYMKNGKIGWFDVLNKENVYPAYEEQPDRPTNPAFGSFYFSANKVPFLIYGAMGKYKLYNLDKKKLKVLSHTASTSGVYFMGNNPGVIIGGAGQRKFVFYDANIPKKILHTLPVRKWQDAAFISKEMYYFIENDKRLKLLKKNKVIDLPFWAEQIDTGLNNELIFISPIGTALSINENTKVEELSDKIFQLGWDLETSK